MKSSKSMHRHLRKTLCQQNTRTNETFLVQTEKLADSTVVLLADRPCQYVPGQQDSTNVSLAWRIYCTEDDDDDDNGCWRTLEDCCSSTWWLGSNWITVLLEFPGRGRGRGWGDWLRNRPSSSPRSLFLIVISSRTTSSGGFSWAFPEGRVFPQTSPCDIFIESSIQII